LQKARLYAVIEVQQHRSTDGQRDCNRTRTGQEFPKQIGRDAEGGFMNYQSHKHKKLALVELFLLSD